MTESSPDNLSDVQLARLTAALRAATTDHPIGAIELAAYLDGRLDESDRELFESRLASDPDALSALIESRAAMNDAADATTFVPGDVLAAARSLVPEPARHNRQRVRTTTPARRLPHLRVAARWSLTAAASLLISLIGYQAGTSASRPSSTTSLLDEMTFGAISSEGAEADAELFALALREVSP